MGFSLKVFATNRSVLVFSTLCCKIPFDLADEPGYPSPQSLVICKLSNEACQLTSQRQWNTAAAELQQCACLICSFSSHLLNVSNNFLLLLLSWSPLERTWNNQSMSVCFSFGWNVVSWDLKIKKNIPLSPCPILPQYFAPSLAGSNQ